MQMQKQAKRRRMGINLWYVLAVLVLTAGLLFRFHFEAQAQQSQGEAQLFEVVNTDDAQKLDVERLEQEFGFGTATIKLDLAADGEITNTAVYPDAVRRGSEGFASTVAGIMRTWRYTPGPTGSFFVAVALPSPNEASEGKLASISVDLTYVQLPEDKSVTISLAKRDWSRVVAQTGFFDQVIVTGAPPEVQEAYDEGLGNAFGRVFANLGPFFQILFGLTFLGGLIGLALAVGAIRQEWGPAEDGRNKLLRGFANNDTMFQSPLVTKIDKLWIKSIKNTQLNSELFTKNNLTSQNIDKIRKGIETTTTTAEIRGVLKGNLLTMTDEKSLFSQKGEELDEGDLVGLKRSVQSKMEQKRDSDEEREDTKAAATAVLAKLDKCSNPDQLRDLLNDNGFPGESMIKRKAASGTGKSHGKLQHDVLDMLKTLDDMQSTLHLNGNSNGRSEDEDALKLEAKEREYEQFLWDHFGEPKVNEALEICKENADYPLFQIYESGLQNNKVNRNRWWSSQEIDRSVDRTAAVRFEEKRGVLDLLWAMGSLSPMFGLGGTVWGISQAFGKIKGVTDTRLLMQKLAGDINIALSTTIVGLILGIGAFLIYYYTKHCLDQQASSIEKHFTDITNLA